VAVKDAAGNTAGLKRTVIVEDTLAPVITLNGPQESLLALGDTYIEPGATAFDLVDGNVTSSISLTGRNLLSVELQVLGASVSLRYQVADRAGNLASVTRTVLIVASTRPIISLVGPTYITLEASRNYRVYYDAGATASSADEGNLTEYLTVSGIGSVRNDRLGTYHVNYSVSSPKDFHSSTTRIVQCVDTRKPELRLIGASEVLLLEGSAYIDAGAVSVDEFEGDLTSMIMVTGVERVNSSALGSSYLIVYSSKDSSNNTVTVSRVVLVVSSLSTATTTTSTSSTSDDPDGSSSQASRSVGIGVGVAAGVLLLLLVLVVLILRRRRAQVGQRASAEAEIKGSRSQPLFGSSEAPKSKSNAWFHGAISRQEAEEKLAEYSSDNGVFLVRRSASTGDYVLSFVFNKAALHVVISVDERGSFVFDGVPCPWAHEIDDIIQELMCQRKFNMPTVLTKPVPPPARGTSFSWTHPTQAPDRKSIGAQAKAQLMTKRGSQVHDSSDPEPSRTERASSGGITYSVLDHEVPPIQQVPARTTEPRGEATAYAHLAFSPPPQNHVYANDRVQALSAPAESQYSRLESAAPTPLSSHYENKEAAHQPQDEPYAHLAARPRLLSTVRREDDWGFGEGAQTANPSATYDSTT
jgi:hypothetical protein